MTYQELAELIPSDTLQRDLQWLKETNSVPGGYTPREIELMLNYLKGEED